MDVFSAQAGGRIMACLYLQFDFIHVSLRNMSRFLLPSVFVGSKIFLTYLLNQWRSRSSFNRKKRGCFKCSHKISPLLFAQSNMWTWVSLVLRGLVPSVSRLCPVCVPAGFNSCFYCSVSLAHNCHHILNFKGFRTFWIHFALLNLWNVILKIHNSFSWI